jgi:hypothetical protein
MLHVRRVPSSGVWNVTNARRGYSSQNMVAPTWVMDGPLAEAPHEIRRSALGPYVSCMLAAADLTGNSAQLTRWRC